MRTVDLKSYRSYDLKRVGFWWSDDEPELPHPRDYVDQVWDPAERDRAISYLEQCCSRITRISLGWSWCRFGCFGGDSSPEMGRGECIDGVWVFPDSFLHYVRHHAVKPPPDFLEHMRKMNFRAADLSPEQPG
jgi:hypothetical protein